MGLVEKQQRYRVAIDIVGQQYDGYYWGAGKMLVVSTAKGGGSTQLGDRKPLAVAEKLLLKLVRDGKA